MTKTAVKRAKKNEEEIVPIVEDLLTKYRVVSDWNRSEKIRNYFDLSNDASDDLLFPPSLIKKLNDKQIKSVFDIPQGDWQQLSLEHLLIALFYPFLVGQRSYLSVPYQ